MSRFNHELGPLGLYKNEPAKNFRLLVAPEAPLIYAQKAKILLNYPAPDTIRRIDRASRSFTDDPKQIVSIWKSYSSLFSQLRKQRFIGKFRQQTESYQTITLARFEPIPKYKIETVSDFQGEATADVIQTMLDYSNEYGGFSFNMESSGLNIGNIRYKEQNSSYQSKQAHHDQVDTWHKDGLSSYPYGMATVTPVGWHDSKPKYYTRSIAGVFQPPKTE